MEPVAEALNVLRQWQKEGFEIAIVTGRPPESFEPSLAWLVKHRVSHDSFIVVDKYSRFKTENTIAISLDELAARQFCWAIEDSLPMAEYLAEPDENSGGVDRLSLESDGYRSCASESVQGLVAIARCHSS